MKKIYIFIAMSFIAGITFGQTGKIGSVTSKKMALTHHESGKAATDTTGISTNFIPTFDLTSCTAIGNQGGGWVFGVANLGSGYFPVATAQGYSCSTGQPFGIDGVTMLFCGKTSVSGDPTSKLTFSIWNKLASDSVPTTQIGTETADLLFSACDTTFPTFNTVMFTTPISVTGTDFSIYCSFANIKTDTIGFICDGQGTTSGVGWNACKIGTTWYTYYKLYGHQLNVNTALFAIVDMNTVGINDDYYYQGAKMTINQNPAVDKLSVDYMVENDSKVKFELISLNGKVVLTLDEGNKQKGIVNSINADISNLASGTYLCSLESNGQRLIKKIVIK